MRLIDVLKVCVLGAFVATIITGCIFVIQSSDENAYARNIHKAINEQHKVNRDKAGDVDFVDVPKEAKAPQVVENAAENNMPTTSTTAKPPVTTTTTTATTTLPPVTQVPTTTTAAAATAAPTVKVPETIAPKILKELKEASRLTSRAPSVHIFYYPWYGSPTFNDGNYVHWNHFRLKPDGSRSTDPKDQYHPPGEIAAVQYPQLGPYSSRDPNVMERHMKWLSSAGIDVVSVSWYPRDKADPSGVPFDPFVPALLNMTDKYKMKVNFHLEPYPGRTVGSVREDIQYLIINYGKHPAFYRTMSKDGKKQSLPLFYVYDSYTIDAAEWQKLLTTNGSITIRNTEWDSLMIGLYVKAGEELSLKQGGFDGLYTYFAAEGFSHGSTSSNWPVLSTFCARENLLFIPSVGPGYNDTAVRPWNSRNSRPRDNGEYYKEHFKMAHTAKADIVSITSFNEWHEGTQIEPAVEVPATNSTSIAYPGYEKGPEQYLQITLEMIKAYFTPHHENIPMKIAPVV